MRHAKKAFLYRLYKYSIGCFDNHIHALPRTDIFKYWKAIGKNYSTDSDIVVAGIGPEVKGFGQYTT
jgi:hypothetical protein